MLRVKKRPTNRVRRWSVALAAATAGGVLAPIQAPVALAQVSVQCQSSVPIYSVRANGDIARHLHDEPEQGLTAWSGVSTIGAGWLGARTLAGPDNRIYQFLGNGELRRFRWNGTDWDRYANNATYEVIDGGWEDYTKPENINLITVDERGDFYNVQSDGNLHYRSYNEATKKWIHRVIDGGWNQYNMIVAAGSGVIYARKPNGQLHRFRYHADSQRWLIGYQPYVAGGWEMFKTVFSPGADILYGIRNDHVGLDGQLLWYRYNEETGTWVSNGQQNGPVVGTGWQSEYMAVATSDACKLVPNPFPQRPAVALNETAPTTVVEGGDGRLQHFYIDSFGRLIHGRQRNAADPLTIDYAAVAGYTGFAQPPAPVKDSDGNVHVAAIGQDGETRHNTFTAATTTWTGFTPIGGWTPGSATLLVNNQDKSVVAQAVTAQGDLWTDLRPSAALGFRGWMKSSLTGFTSEIATLHSGAGATEIVYRKQSGDFQAVRYANGVTSGSRTLPGTSGSHKPAVVLNPDSKLQLFARQADGTVATLRETTGTMTWAALPALSVTGAPSAVMDGAGLIRVSVRGTDGFIYVTEQVAAGSTSYRAWRRLKDANTGNEYPSATDPTMVKLGNGTVVITYRDNDGVSYVFVPAVPTAKAAAGSGGEAEYQGGPAGKPAQ